MARVHKDRKNIDRSEYTTQKSFRLYHDQDAALIAWLAEYAERYKQTDLIRLALYALSGLDMPPELDELLPPQPAPRQLPLVVPEPEPVASAADEFNAIILDELDRQRNESRAAQEELIAIIDQQSHQIAALHDRLDRQPTPVSVSGPAEVTSGGMDMSRPRPGSKLEQSSGIDMSRPRSRPTVHRTPISTPEVEQDTVTDADLIALGKLMSRSIKNAKPGSRDRRGE